MSKQQGFTWKPPVNVWRFFCWSVNLEKNNLKYVGQLQNIYQTRCGSEHKFQPGQTSTLLILSQYLIFKYTNNQRVTVHHNAKMQPFLANPVGIIIHLRKTFPEVLLAFTRVRAICHDAPIAALYTQTSKFIWSNGSSWYRYVDVHAHLVCIYKIRIPFDAFHRSMGTFFPGKNKPPCPKNFWSRITPRQKIINIKRCGSSLA